MKRNTALSFWLAAALVVLAGPQMSHAQDMKNSGPSARSQAQRMVPAQVALANALDAKKVEAGARFRATLSKSVHLKNGTELPDGTTLVGTVTTDRMRSHGTSTMALRFTQADLKGGKTIPIKATITGVFPPQYLDEANENPSVLVQSWDGKSLQIDQIGAISGVDLHSNIVGNNSGVFASTKKDDVKLSNGTRFALAIGAKG